MWRRGERPRWSRGACRPPAGWGAIVPILLVATALGPNARPPSIAPDPGSSQANFARLYTVTFLELGLPHGALWNVSVSGRAWSTENSSVSAQLANGTYQYVGFSPAARNESARNGGYVNGSFTVANQPRTVDLNWTLFPSAASATSAGPSRVAGFGTLADFVIVPGLIAGIVGLALALAVQRRNPAPSIPAPPPTQPSLPPRPAESGVRAADTAPDPDPLGHML